MKIENYKPVKIKNNFFEGGSSLRDILKDEEEIEVFRTDVLNDTTCIACINAIASLVGSMGLKLYRGTGINAKVIHNELTRKLEFPNETQSWNSFITDMIVEMLVNRDSFAMLMYKSGRLIRVEKIESPKLSETYEGSNKWIVEGSIRGKSAKIPYENTLHFRDTIDRFKALESILKSKLIAEKMVNNAFDSNLNGAMKGIINLEGEANEETKKIIKAAFNRVLRSDNDNVGVLDDGMTYTEIKSGSNKTFQDAQVTEIVNDLKKDIHQVYNVPQVMTSIAEGSYNISESLKGSFIDSLLPLIRMCEFEFRRKLLTESEQKRMYFKLDYNTLMRSNSKDRIAYYKDSINNGLMSRAEARAFEDLPYIEGTEELLMSLNYVPLSQYNEYLSKRYNTNTESEGQQQEEPQGNKPVEGE